MLALTFRLLLATFTAIGAAATTTPTTTAAAIFALLLGCGGDWCAVDGHGSINLRHFLLGSRGLRRLIAFRTVTALLVAAFTTATALLLLTFVAGFARFAFRTLFSAIATLVALTTTAAAFTTLTTAAR